MGDRGALAFQNLQTFQEKNMAVRINQSKTYRATVNFTITLENGKKENSSFEATFQRMTVEEITAWSEDAGDLYPRLMKILVGWKMTTPEGDDIPYTEENVRKVCDAIPGLALIIIDRFASTVQGVKEKN